MEIRERIEQILRDHDLQDSAAYFAEVLVSELGLKREKNWFMPGVSTEHHGKIRYVTEWVPDA